MEDEVEVDVLGDFNLENLLTKNEDRISCYDGDNQLGLNCDYSSVTSQWLLDSASQSCWYDNKSEDRSHFNYINTQSTSSNSIESTTSSDVSGWNDKERYLLEKGLELFGRSWPRLAQYIGSKTPPQVKSYVRSMGIEYNLLSSTPPNVSNFGFGVGHSEFSFTELINGMEIPASIEEVIAVVSTAQPTIHTGKTIPRQRHSSSSSDKSRHTNSVIGKGGQKKLHQHKIKQRLRKSKHTSLVCHVKAKKIKKPNISHLQLLSSKNHGKDSIVLPSGEEIIRIQRESVDGSPTENDIQVDIDSDHTENNNTNKVTVEMSFPQLTQVFREDMLTPSGKVMTVIVDKPQNECWMVEKPVQTLKPSVNTVCTKYNSIIQDRLNAVYSLPPPTQELKIRSDQILEEEERFHPEFFGGSHNKQKRYMKIRNHIIECWKSSKPKYVTKTAIRTGLKNCGDVRLISRVHGYLEQRGYINFGCDQCHYKCMISEESCRTEDDFEKPTDNKMVIENTPLEIISSKSASSRGERRKIRRKKVYLESSSDDSEDCGYTMVHMDSGEIIVQHLPKSHIMEAEKEEKRQKRKLNSIKLVYCKQFTKEYCAPFIIEMEISVLLLVDIHSHFSPSCEVIGLLGGTYDYDHKVLSISSAVPCRTTLSNNVHCDMCPVSEYEGSLKLTEEELSVVGWYHSHIDFPPHPSDTDLETQSSMQACFDNTLKPFIGFILTPYFKNTSEFRCIVVRKLGGEFTPFQLHVKLCSKNVDLSWLRTTLETAFATIEPRCLENLSPEALINKCLESVMNHLKVVTPKLDGKRIEELTHEIEKLLISLFAKRNFI